MTILGEIIHHKRRQKNLTLKKVAAMTGLSQPFLTMIELGKRIPSDNVIRQLSEVLDLDTEKVIEVAEKMRASTSE